MPTFVMLSNLSTIGGQSLHTHPDRLTAVDEEIKVMGCRVIAQYALLGRYDFLTILEAPDTETVAHLSVDLASRGTVHIDTLPAISLDTFVDKLKSHEQLGRGEVETSTPPSSSA
jgi:uncharacterized protein with GYD domain